ncbi:MAG: hypothetical protein RLY93_15220 [Sumerlaeia bacterium]
MMNANDISPNTESLYMQLRHLLDLADSIHDSINELRTRFVFRCGILLVALIFVGLFVYSVLSRVISTSSTMYFVLYYGGIWVACTIGVSYLLSKHQRDRALKQRQLQEIVPLIQDLYPTAAEAEDWTPLQRLEFRIRLERYPIYESPNEKPVFGPKPATQTSANLKAKPKLSSGGTGLS